MVRVRRLDGEDAGLQEWVSRSGLLSRWDAVEERLQDEGRLAAVITASGGAAGTAELEAARFVLQHAGLGRQVVLGRSRAEQGVLRVSKPAELAARLGAGLEGLAGGDSLVFIDRSGTLVMPWCAGLAVTQRVAVVFAGHLVGEVHREEERLRSEVTHGWYRAHARDEPEAGPEQALAECAAAHALVRRWCGAGAVDRFDELVALRAEVLRLGGLVERSVEALRKRGSVATAATIERDLGVPVATLTRGLRL
jgi:hypothetical protein